MWHVGESKEPENATLTLTRSEKKLYDIYKLLEDSESETDQTSSEDDDDSDTVFEVEENLVDHRIIDVKILKQNTSSQLCCGFYHGTVHLIEVGRKGLSSELAFHCINERCVGGAFFFHLSKNRSGCRQSKSKHHKPQSNASNAVHWLWPWGSSHFLRDHEPPYSCL